MVLTTRVLTGHDVLERLGPDLDDLHHAVGAPVTARRTWLAAWVHAYRDQEPLAVGIEQGGGLRAAALLATSTGRGLVRMVGMGHGPSDRLCLAALDPEAATALASAVAAALARIRGPWHLRLEELPAGDTVVAALRRQLPRSGVLPGDGSPALRFGQERDLGAYLSRNLRQNRRTMWNRIAREGITPLMVSTRDPSEIRALLPEVERVHRDRDADLIRVSDLDDPRAATFWRSVLADLADAGELELTTLRLDGRLAAYLVGLLDGAWYRMWDARMAPGQAAFSPGRLVVLEAIERALAEPGFEGFDFMRGSEGYKLRIANEVHATEHLVAWSSPLVRAAVEGPRAARSGLKRYKDRHPALERAWKAVKSRALVPRVDR